MVETAGEKEPVTQFGVIMISTSTHNGSSFHYIIKQPYVRHTYAIRTLIVAAISDLHC